MIILMSRTHPNRTSRVHRSSSPPNRTSRVHWSCSPPNRTSRVLMSHKPQHRTYSVLDKAMRQNWHTQLGKLLLTNTQQEQKPKILPIMPSSHSTILFILTSNHRLPFQIISDALTEAYTTTLWKQRALSRWCHDQNAHKGPTWTPQQILAWTYSNHAPNNPTMAGYLRRRLQIETQRILLTRLSSNFVISTSHFIKKWRGVSKPESRTHIVRVILYSFALVPSPPSLLSLSFSEWSLILGSS